ncbi:long-chain-fatty-acid--CoA ligase [Ectothiorhodospiraceae bacterium WFHF3C12]|nr:long-chain-fatty-acid--CoA ligase [Ectothiorhodospiraceae bacterium WFHF3C12]
MHLTQPLHKGRRERPDALACVYAERGRSYAELVSRVARLAGALQRLGLETGDRAGLLGLNSDRYIEGLYAILWAGGVVNPVNTRWASAEMAYSLNDCETRLLLVDDNFLDFLEPLRAKCPALETIVYMGEGEAPTGTVDYETLVAESAPAEDALRSGDDLAAIFYTGGTTGAPKGVMLSHANLYADALGTVAATPRPARAVCLHAAPLFHIGGLGLVFQLMPRLGTHVIMPGFEPAAMLELIERERVQETFLVPTMLRLLLDHEDFGKRDLSSLRYMIYGASPMDAALMDRALERLPGVDFMQAYGMTELSPVVVVLPPENHAAEGRAKLAAAGLPINIAEIRIVDDEDNDVPTGTVGEIAARGPMVMRGYWNKPEQSAEALRGGWMHTGDAGYVDEDGYVYVVDRIKDMIVTGGENVYSAEVEDVILRLPQVAQCAVIGVPDEQWGERVHAVLVLHEGESLSHEDLVAHCRGLIGAYKSPRSSEVRHEMPMSGAGKLLKYKLRDAFWEGRSRRIG